MLNDSLTSDYNEKHEVDSEFDSRLVIPVKIDTLMYIEIEQRRFYNMCQLQERPPVSHYIGKITQQCDKAIRPEKLVLINGQDYV